MRVTPHSTLAISICALALLSQLPNAHSAHGVFEARANTLPPTFAQQHVMKHQKELGLSDIQWSSRNRKTLSFARVTWDNKAAFMKCAIVSVSGPTDGLGIYMEEVTEKEVHAFNALKGAKGLTSLDTVGRQNVMDPLHQFEFYEENRIRYVCHLYSFIDGETLEDYFKRHTISEAYIATSQILPKVIKGLIYLHNAGIIHNDLDPKNIMLEKNPAGGKSIIKIIDLDVTTIFDKGQGWQAINPMNEAYLSSNPPQQYASCNQLKNEITEFLNIFVTLNERENPCAPNYVLTGQVVLDYLKEFQENEGYNWVQLGDVNAATPAIHYLLKAQCTIQSDKLTCSSPIRILRGLEPRTSTTSRPNSPTFQW